MDNVVHELEEMKYKVRDYLNNKPSAEASELEKMIDNTYVRARSGADIDKVEFMVKDVRGYIERIKQSDKVFSFQQTDDLYDRIKRVVVMIDQVQS